MKLFKWWLDKLKEEVFDKALQFFVRAIKIIALVLFLCLLTLVGALVGTVVGVFKGHGISIGAIAGAAVALQLLNYDPSSENRFSLSKEAIMESLMDGKDLMNWATNFSEYMYPEISNFVDVIGESSFVEGMSMESVQKLAACEYGHHSKMNNSSSCSICLEDFEEREFGRRLPNCDHFFHVDCIDQWLHLHGSCPICRKLWGCLDLEVEERRGRGYFNTMFVFSTSQPLINSSSTPPPTSIKHLLTFNFIFSLFFF